jgi:hypothetical protein
MVGRLRHGFHGQGLVAAGPSQFASISKGYGSLTVAAMESMTLVFAYFAKWH